MGPELGLILRCPHGEEWPATSFQSFVDINVKPQTHNSITFLCPAGHSFTLLRAVKSGMLTPEQALKILAEADRWLQLPETRAEIKRLRRPWTRRARKPVRGRERD